MEREYREYNDFLIYAQQGKTAFVKAYLDWADIDKIHLSFVKHSGRDNGCKPIDHIEAALNITSPGAESALYLAEAILNGMMGQKRQAAKKKYEVAKAQGSTTYPEPIFVAHGGSKNPCKWRQIELCPGIRSAYALTVKEADGTENAMGGFTKKQGAEVKRIDIGFSSEELIAFASAIKLAWGAYLTGTGMCVKGSQRIVKQATVPAPAPAPSAPIPSVAPTDPPALCVKDGQGMFVLYDTVGEWFEVAGNAQTAVRILQTLITSAKKKYGWIRKNNAEYTAAKTALEQGCDEIPNVSLYASKDAKDPSCDIIVLKKTMHIDPPASAN